MPLIWSVEQSYLLQQTVYSDNITIYYYYFFYCVSQLTYNFAYNCLGINSQFTAMYNMIVISNLF